MRVPLSRRSLVAGGASLSVAAWMGPARAADDGPIVIGCLAPLTGMGAPYGAGMRDMVAAVVKQANDAGGILGRPVQLATEDDSSSADAGVRAARKLIDVDHVIALLCVWSSPVATDVAPVAWESKTFLATSAAADALTQLPHNGYLIRTQPDASQLGTGLGALAKAAGAKKPAFIGPAGADVDSLVKAAASACGVEVGSFAYDPAKPPTRTEAEAAVKAGTDFVLAGGLVADTAAVLRELARAGFKGKAAVLERAVDAKLLAEKGNEGLSVLSFTPGPDSPAVKAALALSGKTELDPYAAQAFDQVVLTLLAIQLAGVATGAAVKDLVRRVSQGDGPKVGDLAEGLKALKDGAKQLNYEGASGSCTFDAAGDQQDVAFRTLVVKGGKLVKPA